VIHMCKTYCILILLFVCFHLKRDIITLNENGRNTCILIVIVCNSGKKKISVCNFMDWI
jgi:hypothetical protein